jgi:CheY-like chemotaxis protein
VERSPADLTARLIEMGVAVEPLPGGRSLRGRLRISSAPFSTLAGVRRYEQISFSTIGATHIKCLAPLPFFYLPIIALGGCATGAELEQRIREAWAARERTLREAAQKLAAAQIAPRLEVEGQVLAFSLGLDDDAAEGRMIDPRRVIAPGRGPLAGLRAPAPELRFLRFDSTWRHASDVELALTQQLEQLRARFSTEPAPAPLIAVASELPTRHEATRIARRGAPGRRVLLVGPHLGRDAALTGHLRQLGYRVRVEFSAHEALEAFREHSFDLVFADAHLGRSEGIELISDLQAVPGVERVPVVLVDEHLRDPFKEAARRMGAAGYLVHPIDSARVAAGIERLFEARLRRRYRRLPWRLSVRLNGEATAFTTEVARLGAFIGTDWSGPLERLQRCRIQLPELGRELEVETEGVYRVDTAGVAGAGLGLRFRAFSERDEALWIEYLTALFGSAVARGETD